MNPPPSTTTRPPDALPAADSRALLPDESRALLRRGVYAILIALSAGAMIGRILAVNSVDLIRVEQAAVDKEVAGRTKELTDAGKKIDRAALEQEALAKVGKQRPFLGANDRSRWATIRSLVEQGTYAIDDIIKEPNWDTIDMVEHDDVGNGPGVGSSASMHFYSSKPTLLTTILAGEYWLIYHLTGATLGDHPFEIGRFMLITINVIPLAIYFWLLSRMVERYGKTDWGTNLRDRGGRLRHVSHHVCRRAQQSRDRRGDGARGRLCRGADLVRRTTRAALFRRRWTARGLHGSRRTACSVVLGPAVGWFALEGAEADTDCLFARGGSGCGRFLRDELPRPRQLATSLHAPRRGWIAGRLVSVPVSGKAELLDGAERNRPRRTIAGCLRHSCARRSSRHLLAHAGLDPGRAGSDRPRMGAELSPARIGGC